MKRLLLTICLISAFSISAGGGDGVDGGGGKIVVDGRKSNDIKYNPINDLKDAIQKHNPKPLIFNLNDLEELTLKDGTVIRMEDLKFELEHK
jgi:hypothetical protein